jgi:hypothetical protein
MDSRTVTWEGETFKLADKIGLMPWLVFGKLAEAGLDTSDMEALAAMNDLIEQCLDPTETKRYSDDGKFVIHVTSEVKRFKTYATRIRADEQQLMTFLTLAMEAMGKGRSSPASDSSAGQPATSGKSADVYERVAARQEGRPDLQLAVLNAKEAAAS